MGLCGCVVRAADVPVAVTVGKGRGGVGAVRCDMVWPVRMVGCNGLIAVVVAAAWDGGGATGLH